MRFDPEDPIVHKAIEISLAKGKFSTAMLQTYLGKGHGFVADLAIWFEEIGVIGPEKGNKPRDLLISSMDEFDKLANKQSNTSISKAVPEKVNLIPNKLSRALAARGNDYDFDGMIVISFIFSFLIIPFFYGFYLMNLKKKIEEYYNSDEFAKIKARIEKNAQDVNDLNQHIEELKDAYTGERVIPRGESTLVSGGYNFKREGWKLLGNDKNTHYCSAQVVMNSRNDPYKYICKYFDIEPNEENLDRFEELFNDYSAALQGQSLLPQIRNELFEKISTEVPEYVINYTPNRLICELGFKPLSTKRIVFPKYNFVYVSAGGNSNVSNPIEMDMQRMEEFIGYINSQIKWRKSVAGQRALMTSELREKIKERDNYTCKKCGVSIYKEPHLLLEIDHIKPLSKGGITSENNLQTLCWRCNRSKGAKIE